MRGIELAEWEIDAIRCLDAEVMRFYSPRQEEDIENLPKFTKEVRRSIWTGKVK